MKQLELYGLHRFIKRPWYNSFTLATAGLVFVYLLLYPPFISHVALPSSLRLGVETLTLAFLAVIYLLRRQYRFSPHFIYAFLLLSFYGIFGGDAPQQVLAFGLKLFFMLLILRVLAFDLPLYLWVRQLWITLWAAFFVMSLIGFLGKLGGFLPLMSFPVKTAYPYQFNPLVGNLLQKPVMGFMLPRYTGYIDEPGLYACFAGVNFFLAKDLFVERSRQRLWAAMALGSALLTLSYTLYLFLVLYFAFVWTRRVKISINLLISLIAAVTLPAIAFIAFVPDALPNSSALDRMLQVLRAWGVYLDADLQATLFGIGILPLKELIEGGTTSGLLQVLMSRGLALTAYFYAMIYGTIRHNGPLLLFVIYFSLTFDFFWYPLFLTGLALSYLGHRYNQESLDFTKELYVPREQPQPA